MLLVSKRLAGILVSGRLSRRQGRVGIRLSRGKGGLEMVCGGWVGIGLSRRRGELGLAC